MSAGLLGEGEKNAKSVFTLARKLAPCVVFLDEIDSLLLTRGGGVSEGGDYPSRREIVNELMAEWDGVASRNDGVLVMGATNRPFDLDDAVLRRMPRRVLGAFFCLRCACAARACERNVLTLPWPRTSWWSDATVDLPDRDARREILTLILRDEALAADVNLDQLADMTASYSGSDLKNLCMAAALNAVRRASRPIGAVGLDVQPNWANVPGHRSLTGADFTRAFDEVRAATGAHRAVLPSHGVGPVAPSLT